MQFYLPGINPLFWRQISALPIGPYNHEATQASAANIDQLFVAYVNKPVDSVISIVVNGTQQATAKVMDDTGMIYARFKLPYTNNQPTIAIELRDTDGVVLDSETFATSYIAYLFEIQSAVLTPYLDQAIQLEQNVSIDGVDNALLYDKYGVFTGLSARSNQDSQMYRVQTACLWAAFTYAATEKGLHDAIQCLCKSNVDITLVPTKDITYNLIYDAPQWWDSDSDTSGPPFYGDNIYNGITVTRRDLDDPHYYIADTYPQWIDNVPQFATGETPEETLGPYDSEWTEENAHPFVIASTEAHGAEILIYIGEEETDAAALVSNENIYKRPSGYNDNLANTHILPVVTVISATINGETRTGPAAPQEDTDFTVNRLTGEITWTGPLIPDEGTYYQVTYETRLDTAIQTIVRQVKPAHCSVVIVFSDVTSGLPVAIKA